MNLKLIPFIKIISQCILLYLCFWNRPLASCAIYHLQIPSIEGWGDLLKGKGGSSLQGRGGIFLRGRGGSSLEGGRGGSS